MRSSTVEEGEELRGFRVKLYPTQEELKWLFAAQEELMAAWNVLVISRQTHVEHCVRYCDDRGLIEPLPPRPTLDRASGEPEALAAWAEYERLCGLRRFEAVRLTRDVPDLTWDDWRVDYKTLRELFGGRGATASAQMFSGLVQTFRKTKGPVLKRRPLQMPLLNRTGGVAIILAEPEVLLRRLPSGNARVGSSRRCTVKFGPLRLKARFHRPPPGPFIEGISIKLEHDGWYAAARVRVAPPELPAPSKPVIAINPGLECLYADSEGFVLENPRGNAYSLEVRRLSERVDAAEDDWTRGFRRNQLARYQERHARKTKYLVHSQILPRLSEYAVILISESPRSAAQGVQTRISAHDAGGYVSAMAMMTTLIAQRFGRYDAKENPSGRVRVVEGAGISRRCSCCGAEHPRRYNRDNRRRRDQLIDCRTCRAHVHVDVNAARNLLSDYCQSLEPAKTG